MPLSKHRDGRWWLASLTAFTRHSHHTHISLCLASAIHGYGFRFRDYVVLSTKLKVWIKILKVLICGHTSSGTFAICFLSPKTVDESYMTVVLSSLEFSSFYKHICWWYCSVTKSCPNLYDPMDSSMPGSPVLYHLPEFSQIHVHRVGDAIQPSHPLSSPFPPAFNLSQHQGPFQWVGCLYQVAKVLELVYKHIY